MILHQTQTQSKSKVVVCYVLNYAKISTWKVNQWSTQRAQSNQLVHSHQTNIDRINDGPAVIQARTVEEKYQSVIPSSNPWSIHWPHHHYHQWWIRRAKQLITQINTNNLETIFIHTMNTFLRKTYSMFEATLKKIFLNNYIIYL